MVAWRPSVQLLILLVLIHGEIALCECYRPPLVEEMIDIQVEVVGHSRRGVVIVAALEHFRMRPVNVREVFAMQKRTMNTS
jgi:hypothetical protein